jgi:hypothetical protein
VEQSLVQNMVAEVPVDKLEPIAPLFLGDLSIVNDEVAPRFGV